MPEFVAQLGPVVLQTFILYIFLIAGLRLLGRRQTSELTTAELAVIMIVGSSVETALIAGDSSLLAGLVSASTLFITDHMLSALQERWGWLHRIMLGRPIPLVYNGQYLVRRMDQAGLSQDDVLHGIRQLGYDKIDQVKLAMLEISGQISVLPVKQEKSGEGGSGGGKEDKGDRSTGDGDDEG